MSIRWARPYRIAAPILSNVLRGAFGLTFRRLVCPPDFFHHPCKPCPLYASCPYGAVFEPTPSAGADRLRKQSDLPRPFVFKPPLASDPHEVATLNFGLMLFGLAIDSLPQFVVTLAQLGREGMGPARVPFEIESIVGETPAGLESLYDPARHEMRSPLRFVSEQDLQADMSGAEPTGLPLVVRVRFLTPTWLTSGSGVDASGGRIPAREVRERPPFGVIIRRARDRLAALSAFFGEQSWEHPDFAGLGMRADEVRLLASRTEWMHRDRRSTRTGRQHEISGLVGEALYEFPTPAHAAELWPLLRFAEYAHVGKHAVWGNGWLRAEAERGTADPRDMGDG